MFTDRALARITDGLAEGGLAVVEDAVPPAIGEALQAEAEALEAAGRWQAAAVGRAADRRIDHAIRSDRIAWLGAAVSPAQAAYLDGLEALTVHLRRSLFLGVHAVEAHFACFEPGAYYTRHLDRFRLRGARLVSTVFYLNPEWRAGDGGALRIYDPDDEDRVIAEVAPRLGTFCAFLSDRIWHEVLPAARRRLSVAGWLREAPAGV
ncbi:MAG: 2OG-Fe(II) oxygenase [Nannocystaceae bacterium]